MPDPAFDPDVSIIPRSIPRAVVDLVRRIASLSVTTRAALHGVRQRIRRGSDGDNNNPGASRIRRARRDLDDAEDMLVMEYVPNGTLGSWLDRLTTRGNGDSDANERVRIPEKILWSILNCLWRSCVAMAYPGRQQGDGQDPRRTQIPVATELMPPRIPRQRTRDRGPTDPLVHFDLDPSNGRFVCQKHPKPWRGLVMRRLR